jgi:hypothetical protein
VWRMGYFVLYPLLSPHNVLMMLRGRGGGRGRAKWSPCSPDRKLRLRGAVALAQCHTAGQSP